MRKLVSITQRIDPAHPALAATVPKVAALARRVDEVVVLTDAAVDERSFPLPSRKLRAIGHGIDLSEFTCVDGAASPDLRLLALGRYSPAKGIDVVLRALAVAGERV